MSSVAASSGELAAALGDEIDFEKKESSPLDKQVKKYLESRFDIANTKRSSKVTFTKKGGDEKVVITLDAGNPEWLEPEDNGDEFNEEGEKPEGEEEEPRDTHLYFATVAVTKPGKSHQLVFETFLGEATGVDLRNVHYAPVGADLDTLGHKGDYTGPEFDELDDALKAAMETYLTDLGVDFEFAASAFQFAEWKEATEYAGWLHDVKEFLE